MIHTFIFLLGAMAGATVGVIIMAMLTIAKRADKDELRALGGLPEAGHWKVAPRRMPLTAARKVPATPNDA